MKRKLSIALVFVIITGLLSAANVFADPKDKVKTDKKEIKTVHSLFNKNQAIIVPVNDFAAALGGTIKWDDKTKTTWVVKGKMSIELKAESDVAYIHRQDDFTGIPQKCELDAPLTVIKNVTYVPVTFVAEVLDLDIDWLLNARIVNVNSNKYKEAEKESKKEPVKKSISFTNSTFNEIKNNKKMAAWYEKSYQKEGVHYIKDGKTVYVLASAGKKPTGGYTVGISSVELIDKHTALVSAFVTSPSPDMMVTQAVTYPHALIKLDQTGITKVKGSVKVERGDWEKKLLPYEILTSEKIKENKAVSDWYQSIYKIKGILHKKSGSYVYIAVNAGEKSTGGYSIQVDEVAMTGGSKIFVTAHVNSPSPDSMVTTALTYPSVLIRVKAADATSVTGEIKEKEAAKTFKELVRAYTTRDVKTMELRNLEGTKIKDFKLEEMASILDYLNNSKIDNSPHIEMLAGNSLYMTMVDGSTINFWSYGSKTNFIAVVKSGNSYNSYHLVSPEIAKILLAKY